MPLYSTSQIVGGGAQLLAPVTVDRIPRVVDVGPPGALSDSELRQWDDAGVAVITVGGTDVRPGVGATETFRLRDGFISSGAGQDSTVIGRGASAPNTDSIVIGRASASGALSTDAIAIGRSASAGGSQTVVIGGTASANAASDVVIGFGASSNAINGGVVIGQGAFAQANGGGAAVMAIGRLASVGRSIGSLQALGIGNQVTAREDDLVIGHSASSNQNSTANRNTVIGLAASANVSGGNDVVIGYNASVTAGTGCVVIGVSSTTNQGQCILLGRGITNTSPFTGYFGGPNTDIQTFIIGAGGTAAAPSVRTVRFTNGTGTNVAAGQVIWEAPRSTGNAASAPHLWRIGTPGASGTTLQATLDAMRLSFTNTAGQTALEIYDVDTAGLQRVLVGAAGTGPGGVGRALYLA